MRITKVYTKGGDDGTTALIGGTRVKKDHPRVNAYGVIDELNSIVGLLNQSLCQQTAPLRDIFVKVQHQLFDLGARLAADEASTREKMPLIEEQELRELESHIDTFNEALPALSSFVLPGGGQTSAWCHLARTVCRRAERAVVALAETDDVEAISVRYLNRLSDAFFVFGRWASVQTNHPEELWQPNLRKKSDEQK